MRALLFVAVVGLAAGAPIVPEGAAAAVPPTQSYSIWALAKRFFTARENIKAKISGAVAATSMPKEIGVGYKHVLEWYCLKEENKAKPLCQKATSGTTQLASLTVKPPISDSVLAVKAYCAEASNKAKAICTWSKITKRPAPGSTVVVSQPTGAPAGAPAAATPAKKAGKGKGAGAKKKAA